MQRDPDVSGELITTCNAYRGVYILAIILGIIVSQLGIFMDNINPGFINPKRLLN